MVSGAGSINGAQIMMNSLMSGPVVFKRSCKLMGNHFELSVVADNEGWADERIEMGITEIRRIEKLLTTFSDDSETNLVNQNAGIMPVTSPPWSSTALAISPISPIEPPP